MLFNLTQYKLKKELRTAKLLNRQSAEKLDTLDEGTEEYREALWDLDDSWEDIQRIKHQLGQKTILHS